MSKEGYVKKYAIEAVREELKERFRAVLRGSTTNDLLAMLDCADSQGGKLLSRMLINVLS